MSRVEHPLPPDRSGPSVFPSPLTGTRAVRPLSISGIANPDRRSAYQPLRGLVAACASAWAWVAWTVAAWAQPTTVLPPGIVPCVTNDVPAAYGTFLLSYGASYLQTNAAPPVETPSPGAFAWFELTPPPSFVVSNVVVAALAGYRAELRETEDGRSVGSESFASESEMTTRVVPGNWSARLDLALSNSPPFLGFFRFQLADRTPPVPRLSNPEAFESIDVASNLVVSWDAWTGIATNDRIHVEIRDPDDVAVFSASTGCGGETSIAPGATSVTIPGGRLAVRTRYSLHLTFGATLLDSRDRATQLLERGMRTRTTRFEFRTPGPSGEEVVLTEPRVSAAGTHLIFTLTGTPRTTYAIESSTNLTSWKLERVTTLPLNGAANLSLPLPGGTIPGFWRAVPLGDVSSPARISIEAIGANREFLRLRIEGTPGLTYRIESSTNLINWNQLFPFAITIPPNSTQATFNLFGNRTARFSAFRAVAGPR